MPGLLWLVTLAPLGAAVVAGVMALSRRAERAAPWLTIAATVLALGVALGAREGHVQAEWLTIPPRFAISLGVSLDHLALLMVVIVCVVSVLVQLYSVGYMAGETGYARYFAYLALFTTAMLGLVVADNLFQLYVCWELVGICSYLLIGFWWSKPSAANAAKKAFVVTRFGDVGFMLGVLLLATAAGSFRFDEVTAAVSRFALGQASPGGLLSAQTFLWLVPLLLFCGAVGKSAQFPLHVWLPDAMEGPTPVSALIHAATMVAAGVYMVARLMDIFVWSPTALDVVLLIGAVTALIGATIALTQNDIKKVLAYSTISQLGYMMMGLGAGNSSGEAAGMFHLATHAFFKALLFLAAGSVIHALHHSEEPNNLARMGGLMRRMPVTAWTCLAGVLALAGFPLLSGFWSKDSILTVLLERGGVYLAASGGGPLGIHVESGAHAAVALVGAAVGIVVAGLTAFYALRMWLLAFWGEPRSAAAQHARESPAVMTLPLVLLAVPTLALGWYLHHGERLAVFLLGHGQVAERPYLHLDLVALTSVLALAGLWLAWRGYGAGCREADPVSRVPGYSLFANLWYLDAFWTRVGAGGALAVGRAVAWVDRHVVDRYVANGPGWLCKVVGRDLQRTSNGQTQTYAAAMLGAIVVIIVALIAYETQSAGPPPLNGAAVRGTAVSAVLGKTWPPTR